MHAQLLLLFLIVNACSFVAQANDGAYTGSGTSLKPIHESQISIRKELLIMKRVGNSVHVSVHYEMFNPGQEKTITVGFEGSMPGGDARVTPVDGAHPYITDFEATVNGEHLPFDITFIGSMDPFADRTKRRKFSLKEAENATQEEGPYIDYVYTFKARFRPGVNTIRHSYVHTLSDGVTKNYGYDYILTAANRWANKQIDDFTLIIDMGPFENFYVPMTFFNGSSGWKIIGKGSMRQRSCVDGFDVPKGPKQLWFTIEQGYVEFTAKNFRPQGELMFGSPGVDGHGFDCDDNEQQCDEIPEKVLYSVSAQRAYNRSEYTAKQIEILENLPYARRGMIFKESHIQRFYERCTDWYVPNPSYVPKSTDLLPEERSWLMSLRQ